MAKSPLHCLPIQTANTEQLWRKSAENLSVFVTFFLTVRKAVAAGADVFRTKAARRHALEDSYGDVVRNLKG